MMMLRHGLAAALVIMPFNTQAATQPASCPTPVAPPSELSGWTSMAPVTAGPNAGQATTTALGSGARATLLPNASVIFAPSPQKAPAASSHGGIIAFTAPVAGRYRVALGAGAWVDVIGGGKALPSIGHGHGPDCSGIRKMVDFDLVPGRYLVQIAGSPDPVLPMMVTRLNH